MRSDKEQPLSRAVAASAAASHADVVAGEQSRDGGSGNPGGGLRERKKQRTRQLISDTATSMFLDRGFDEVRVAEIAEACDVSEKTVYNYFPSKEALLLDEDEQMEQAVRAAACGSATSPVKAMLDVLQDKTSGLTHELSEREAARSMSIAARFFDLIERSPSLRAHHRDNIDRLAGIAATSLAERAQMPAHSPEIQTTAYALISLWRIQIQSLQRHVNQARTPDEVIRLVLADVDRAAQLLDSGLSPFWQEHPRAAG